MVNGIEYSELWTPEIVEERILSARKCFSNLCMKEYSFTNLESFFRARSYKIQKNSIYYGFRLMGDDIDVDDFIQSLNKAIEILQFDSMIKEVSEEKLLSDFDHVWNSIVDGDILIIRECKSAPMNEEEAVIWKKIGTLFKQNPGVCKILCLQNRDEVKNRFITDEELYYRVFNFQIEFRKIDKESLPEFVYDKLNNDGYIVKEDFKEELKKYVNSVYDKADYKERKFFDDLMNRIFTEYAKKNRKGVFDQECVPYYKRENSIDSDYLIKKYDDKKINDSDKFKNILILALSTFGKSLTTNTYTYFNQDGLEYTVEGTYQLDPIPRKIFDDLICNEKKIDEIILIVSKEVTEPKEVMLDEKRSVKYENCEELGVSALDYFKNEYHNYIDNYFKNNQKTDKKSSDYYPVYKCIEWGDRSNESILNTVSVLLDEIRKCSKEPESTPRIFVDIHGGLRDVQQMIISILSLLSLEGKKIQPQDVYTVEFGKNHIVNAGGTINIFNFVSGMNELIHYGRTNSFKEYDLNDSENTLITTLNNIAESIQLLRVNDFEKNIGKLKNDIDSVKEEGYLKLFIKNIKQNYEEILNEEHTILDEINWCMKMGFYQQALTLIESKIPAYFVEKKFIEYPVQVIRWGNNKKKKYELYNYLFNNLISKCIDAENRLKYLNKYVDENKNDNNYSISNLSIAENDDLFTKEGLKEIEIQEEIHSLLKIHFALKELRNNSSHGGTLDTDVKIDSEVLKNCLKEYMEKIDELTKNNENKPYIIFKFKDDFCKDLYPIMNFLNSLNSENEINIDETEFSMINDRQNKEFVISYKKAFKDLGIYKQMKTFCLDIKTINSNNESGEDNPFEGIEDSIVSKILEQVYSNDYKSQNIYRYKNHESNSGNDVKGTTEILSDLLSERRENKKGKYTYEFAKKVYDKISSFGDADISAEIYSINFPSIDEIENEKFKQYVQIVVYTLKEQMNNQGSLREIKEKVPISLPEKRELSEDGGKSGIKLIKELCHQFIDVQGQGDDAVLSLHNI